MRFSAAILTAAFAAMKWLLGAVAALLIILTTTQWLRGDADARPAMTLSLAAGFGVLSVLSAVTKRKLEAALLDDEE